MILVRWFDSWHSIYYIAILLVITVMFRQSTFSVNEGAGRAQLVLVLGNPSSSDITITVFNTDVTAYGEYWTWARNFKKIL